jgi:hypothetical protein
MDQPDDDEGPDLCLAEAAAAVRVPAPPADDYARHVRAEQRWQAKVAARRLWAQVARWFALGR